MRSRRLPRTGTQSDNPYPARPERQSIPTRSDLVLTQTRCSLIEYGTRSVWMRRRPPWVCGPTRAPQLGLSRRPRSTSNGYGKVEKRSPGCTVCSLRYEMRGNILVARAQQGNALPNLTCSSLSPYPGHDPLATTRRHPCCVRRDTLVSLTAAQLHPVKVGHE